MTKRGLLVDGSVTNLLTANQSSFEDSSVAQIPVRCAHEQSGAWSKHGQYSQKVTRGDDLADDAYMWYRCPIAEMGFEVETPFIAQVILYLPPDCWYAGRDMAFKVRFAGGGQSDGTLTSRVFTLCEGENLLWVVDELDYAGRQWVEYLIREAGAEHRAPAGTTYYTDCHMVEVGTKMKGSM